MNTNGYARIFGRMIEHPNVDTIYKNSVVMFLANVIGGILGTIFDVATNYVVIYAIMSLFTQSELIKFPIALTASILLGLADIFLLGSIRTLKRKDIFVLHMAFGAGCLVAVAFYDLWFSAQPLQNVGVEWWLAWALSAFSTLLEFILFETLDDYRKVQAEWNSPGQDEKIYAEFLGRRLFKKSVQTIYGTISDFHAYFFGGLVAIIFRVGAIVIGVLPIVGKFLPDQPFLQFLIALVFSIVLSMVDFYTFSTLQLLLGKKLVSSYAGVGLIAMIAVSFACLRWGATPLINGGLDVGLAWALSGATSALMVIFVQTLIDWNTVNRDEQIS